MSSSVESGGSGDTVPGQPGAEWTAPSDQARSDPDASAATVTDGGPIGVTDVAALVRLAARRRPHAAAIRGLSEAGGLLAERTWGQLDADVELLATGLRASGAGQGDRVGLLLGDPAAFVAAMFAVLRAGCLAVPLNPTLTPHEVTTRLRDVGPRVVLADAATSASVPGGDDAGPIVVAVGSAPWERLAAGRDARDTSPAPAAPDAPSPRAPGPAPHDPERPAVLLFTAGTGGRPRPAILTHRAVLAAVDQQLRLDPAPLRPDDAVLVAVPLFHAAGLVGGVVSAAATGATMLLPPGGTAPPPAPGDVGATTVLGSPHLFATWSASPDVGRLCAGVRLLGCVGAPLPVAVAAGLETLTGATPWTGYGAAETASLVTASLGGTSASGSVGSALPGVELSLRDDAGAVVDDGDPGEVWVRADSLFSGYWPDGSDGPDPDGWFATGDVGYLDDAGELHLVDRRREVVFVSGFNVYPREVEQAIATHPGVLECAVVGVAHPVTGEAVKAYVVPRAGATVTVDDVLAACATRLARFKRPTIVVMTAELPHTEAGTVVKALLRVDEGRRPETGGASA